VSTEIVLLYAVVMTVQRVYVNVLNLSFLYQKDSEKKVCASVLMVEKLFTTTLFQSVCRLVNACQSDGNVISNHTIKYLVKPSEQTLLLCLRTVCVIMGLRADGSIPALVPHQSGLYGQIRLVENYV